MNQIDKAAFANAWDFFEYGSDHSSASFTAALCLYLSAAGAKGIDTIDPLPPSDPYLSAKAVEAMADRVRELETTVTVLRDFAIYQDCGRLCDADPKLAYREQMERSAKYVDQLVRQALNPNHKEEV